MTDERRSSAKRTSPGRERIWSAPGPRWSTSCGLSLRGSGPVRWGCSRACTARSRSRSLSATPAPPTRAVSDEQRLQAFLARQRYTGGRSPAQLLAKLRRAPRPGSASSSWAPAESSCAALVTTIKTLNAQIRQLERQIATAVREHPDGADLPLAVQEARQRDHRRRAASRDRRLPRALPHPRHARRRRRPSRCRDRVRQTQEPPASAGPATSACARRSSRWRTPAATTTPGRRTSTPPPAPAGTTTRAQSVPSAVAGAESYGAAGRTACPTTPPATAPCNDTSQSLSPPRRAPGPTQPPPSGWPAPPSPDGRPAGPSAQRLTASRHPLSQSALDTGRPRGQARRACGLAAGFVRRAGAMSGLAWWLLASVTGVLSRRRSVS